MKSWTLAAVAMAVLAGACGTQESSQRTYEEVSCTLQVPADVDSIKLALQQVAEGSLDPCSGSLANSDLYAAQLSRIDRANGSDAFVEMVFAMRRRHPTDPLPLRP